jgi:hypothetical protein
MDALWTHTATSLVRPLEATGRQAPLEGKEPAGGYDFHHPAVLRNVPPPTVHCDQPLRWWSLDRRRRLAVIMRLRDQLQDDILRLADRRSPALAAIRTPSAHHACEGEQERFAVSRNRLTGDATALA